MFKRQCLMTLALILCLYSFTQAQYKLVDGFPNISFYKPVLLTYSPDQTNRVFVVEQTGKILVFPNDPDVIPSQVDTFLDITDKLPDGVPAYAEYGLLGLAFHPDYAENGTFFIDYVTTRGETKTHVSKYQVSKSDPNKADDTTETILLEVNQPFENHNAGMLTFGNDGYLYISLGDGGWDYPNGAPDPDSTAQDLTKLLGSILRIDVDNPSDSLAYGIPPDNPFVGNDKGYRVEIFAYGFRNPWRFNIDPITGKIWVGDVGLDTWEEIDIAESGKNYGWSQTEGFECRSGVNCDTSKYEPPIFVYPTGIEGCAITGGAVYRGQNRPELFGKYIYADWCQGKVWSLEDNGDSTYTNTLLTDEGFRISSFGMDENDELYVVQLDFYNPSKIYKFPAAPTSVKESKQVPKSFSLLPNYPNPFNPSTHIPFQLKTGADYELAVYDMTGRRVRLLESGYKTAGLYTSVWNGRNDKGELVGSGVYMIRLKSGDRQVLRKATLLK